MNDDPIGRSFQVDPMLVSIVDYFYKNPPSEPIDLILTIGGSTITGELVDLKTWWKERFESSLEMKEENPSADSQKEVVRRFIHLRKARFYQGGQPLPAHGDGFLWRGRIAAIDGFVLGKFSSTPADLGSIEYNQLKKIFVTAED